MNPTAIAAQHLSKSYGGTVAVDDLSFTVEPGTVTGFLGPNGAGKSTTLRMILGLDRPTSGRALVGGRPYAAWESPRAVVGALLDPSAVHPRRTARAHLQWIARSTGVPGAAIDPMLEMVGIAEAGDRPAAALSLGMRQRLGLAAALLGGPSVLILDEPLNGLDPEGIIWLRHLVRAFAAAGGTVLMSSHLMNEMQATADHVVVIARGRLVASMSVSDLAARTADTVDVEGEGAHALVPLLERRGARVVPVDASVPDRLTVAGLDPLEINRTAWESGVTLRELSPRAASLETAFIELTTPEAAVPVGVGATREDPR